ncbi:MAG TPA: hypothetical protein VL978_12240 [Puia sp.]|nr:hypothetical protein [Puia sp.]
MTIQKAIIPDPGKGGMIEKLVVDGKLDMESSVHDGSWEIRSMTTYIGLLDYGCDDEVFNGCWGFCCYDPDLPWYNHPITMDVSPINVDRQTVSRDCTMTFEIGIDLAQWNKPYSFNTLKACYARRCANMSPIIYSDNEDDGYIRISCTIEDRKKPLRPYHDHLIHCLVQLKDAEQALLHETTPDGPETLTVTFNFPPEIRSACNQYLMYFGQFLEDLGILADTSLRENMNKVLFTVTPHNKDQAMDVIYEALDVFLHAPDAEEMAEELTDHDFAHYQWKMTIYHLKAQLELAKALLQAKDATIEALRIANYQVRQPPPPAATLPTTDPVPAAAEKEDEDILGGAVSITKYKAKGFTINLPRIIRKLRRKK